MKKLNWLLNNAAETKAAQVVSGPAFSLTKVLGLTVPVMTALTALLTAQLKSATFNAWQITVLVVMVVAFLTVTASVDVASRARATAAKSMADAQRRVALLARCVPATLTAADQSTTAVSVAAWAFDDPPSLLCVRADGTTSWEPADTVTWGEANA